MIELPQTLRVARIDELPRDSSVSETLGKIDNNNIVEGYTLNYNKGPEQKDIAFNFYAEININNSRLWDLIVGLSGELPDPVALIFGHCDGEPIYGRYISKEELLKELEKYKKEITQDTFIELGLIYSTKDVLVEFFVSEYKYTRFWGVKENTFIRLMKRFRLNEVDDIEFIDEYPTVRVPLDLMDNTAISSIELIESLKTKYKEAT